MRVLVTRPLDDVGPLVAALQARGHTALVEPMLSIERRAGVALPLPLEGVQALLFTSANGVRAFADLAPERDLPVFAVGDASATAARDAGFAMVESAGGDVADLARLVAATLDPGQGDLFHPAASQLAGDLQGALEDAGFTLRRAALYEAQPAVELSPALRRALADGDLDAAIFFSPRTARTFVSLIERAGLGAACARLQAVCLSKAVAARLNALSWTRVLIASRPEQDAVLARLDEAATHASDSPPPSSPHLSDGPLNAPDVIAAFGGIRPMANKLGVAVSTVQGWRERGSIPAARHAQVTAAAKKYGVRLDLAIGVAGNPSPASPTPPKEMAPKAKPPKAKPLPSHEPQARPAAATAPAPEAATRIAAPSIRWWGAFALGVVAVVIGAGLAIVGREVWLADAPQRVADTPVVDNGAITNLETRLAAVESDNRDQSAITRIEDEISAIQGRLNGLATDLAAAADSPTVDTAAQSAALRDIQSQVEAQVQALSGRIDVLDEKLGAVQGQLETVAVSDISNTSGDAPAAGEVALALVVAQLRDAVRGSAPFTAELQAVLDLAKSPAFAGGSELVDALTPLIPLAETGVPVLAKLRADFPAVAREIIGRGQGATDDDWLAGIKRRVSGLISVRPVGQVVGESPTAIAARAEAALGDDDLAGAVRELSALTDPAAGAARDWLVAAKARLAVRTALNQLGRGLIVRLDTASE